MRTKLTSLFLVVATLLSFSVFAQKETIKGLVRDAKGNALEGVTIKVANSKVVTTSNKTGSYTINASVNDVLEFSFVGFETKKQIAVGSNINIVLTATTSDLQDIILVGSRGAGRVKTESPVPVDVIKLTDVGMNTARMDLTSTLNFVAPSFNYNKQSGADGADHVDIGTLRG